MEFTCYMPGSFCTLTNLIPMLVLWGIGHFCKTENLIQIMNGRAKIWTQFSLVAEPLVVAEPGPVL